MSNSCAGARPASSGASSAALDQDGLRVAVGWRILHHLKKRMKTATERPRARRGSPSEVASRRQPAETAFREQLREAKLKVTSGRLSVLRELSGAKGPMSHSEVAQRLEGESLDKVTVWRVLVALTEAGLVDRSNGGDGTWRFELRSGSMGHDPHPHFTCVVCKTVTCLPRESVRIPPRIVRGVVDVQITGRCESCD
ncbi:MAG: transcriptional repressor [Labilithrix sp.]|nr:transcriptional repressor [Labilithrix sp.]